VKFGPLALALLAIIGGFAPAWAQDARIGELGVSQPWARASIGKAKNGAAYMTIANDGATSDRLIGVSSPVAKKAALHTHEMQGEVMKMRRVAAIEVGPGQSAVLKPGGLHVMLMGLKAPLAEGASFPLTLSFEKAGALDIRVEVHAPDAMAPGPARGKGQTP
jgi:copper(I)-binding protein